MWFTSGNAAGCPPEVFAALAAANANCTAGDSSASQAAANETPGDALPAFEGANETAGYSFGYGADPLTEAVQARIRRLFGHPDAVVHLVATGTAANALALACLCPPWGTVFCAREAHILMDECGAPEFFAHGSRMLGVDGPDGRISPQGLRRAVEGAGQSLHNMQRGALSLTNVTEAGTVYTAAQTAELAEIAKDFGLPVHLDGARFCNAVAATGASPAALSWRAGVDVLSFGGTKNGLLGVEAVVIFNPNLAESFTFRRKRGGHLLSKGRFLAAQMLAMLEEDRWLSWASHANAMAARLAQGLAARGVRLAYPVQANILFPQWDAGLSSHLRAHGAQFYDMPAPEGMEGARLVTSWSTTPAEVDAFLNLFKGLRG